MTTRLPAAFSCIALAAWLCVSSANAAVVGYWTFEGDLLDQVNSNNGTGVNGAGFSADVPGAFSGQSLDLTGGGNKYVTIPNEQDFDLTSTGSLSIALWVKGEPGGWNPFVSKNGEPNGWQFRRYGGNPTISWTTRGFDPGSGDFESAGTNVFDGGWHHIAGTFDGTVKRIYIDGVFDRAETVAPKNNGEDDSPDPVIFGARSNGGISNFFNGKLDNILIDNGSLAPNQISYLAAGNGPTGMPAPDFSGLPGTFTGRYSYAQQTDGTWNRIELHQPDPGLVHFTVPTYNNALAYAPSVGVATGNTSFLATPRSTRENTVLKVVMNGGSAWFGANDNAVEGEWRLADDNELIWNGLGSGSTPPGSAVPGAYTNWNGGGEPNDWPLGDSPGGTENAGQLTGNGTWNDHQQNNPTVTNKFLVEIATALPEKPAVPILDDPVPGNRGEGTGRALWGVRRVNLPVVASDWESYDAYLYSGGSADTVTAEVPVINFEDPDGPGGGQIAPNPVPYPGDQPGVDDDQFMIRAVATIRIPEDEGGAYTFAFRGDDGGRLTIKGAQFRNVGIVAGSRAEASTEMYKGQPQATRDTLDLTMWGGNVMASAVADLVPGTYEVVYSHFEGSGGADTELLAAKGEVSGLGGTPIDVRSKFRLIGHQAGEYADMTVLTPGLLASWDVELTTPLLAPPPAYPWDLSNIAAAEAALDGGGTLLTDTPNDINYNDPGDSTGSIPGDVPFPGTDEFADWNQFAARATGLLLIPADGTYRFGFQGDDGGYLQIVGETGWTIVETANATYGIVVGDRIQYDFPTGNSRTIGEIELTAGIYTINTLFFERGGGAYWEVFASGGDTLDNYQLLTTGGASETFYGDFDGIQLVPEPSSMALALLSLIGVAFAAWRRRSA